MDRSARIMVAGARGLVGGAIVRQLRAQGFETILTPGRAELDLTNRTALDAYLAKHKPQFIFDAAAKVGGIQANNQFPGDFIRENLLIQTNLIDAAYRAGVEKFVFLGSSCIYPKFAPQPMKEEHLLTGILEPTNSAYAVAKIAGIEMVQAYRRQFGFKGISLMPTNLYGPGDNYDLNNSHVLPALIRKFHEAKQSNAKEVVIWGTGTPRREFLHCDDLADAAIFLMQTYDSDAIINVGVGEDIAIGDLARLVKEIVGFGGALVQDTSKPDGTPRKLLDVSRLTALGWQPKLSLRAGITQTYAAYQASLAAA